MGGKPKQVNSAQATAANAGATQAAQQSSAIASDAFARAKDYSDFLYGADSPIRGFASGRDLDKVAPEGVYRIGLNQTVKTGERELDNAKSQMVGEMSNRGFGMDAGAALDAMRKNALARAGMKGAAFADAAGQQHQEALNNFWNASSSMGTAAGAAEQAALTGNKAAADTYTNIYGTAGQQARGGGAAQIVGAGLGAAGTVGAAAMCPVHGSLILMADGEEKEVQDLRAGDEIAQLGGGSAVIAWNPIAQQAEAVEVLMHDGSAPRVSETHCYSTPEGGYVEALTSRERRVRGKLFTLRVEAVNKIGIMSVYPIVTEGGNNTYCVDGVWSLE